MEWKGEIIATSGDVLGAVVGCQTPEEAQAFLRQYRLETPYADKNIGYLGGYCSDETNKRIQDWFGVEHPIFGKTTLTAEEAFNAGVTAMEGHLRQGGG